MYKKGKVRLNLVTLKLIKNISFCFDQDKNNLFFYSLKGQTQPNVKLPYNQLETEVGFGTLQVIFGDICNQSKRNINI